ncbi:sensor histidine kinase [bacterium]|nr:sensor histidine kinase [candidate division CSSED10-310 bacterium]
MKEIALHILDIVENSIRAESTTIEINIFEYKTNDQLVIQIKDNGKGMDTEILEKVCDPFYSTKTVRRIGIGLSMLKQAAQRAGGTLQIDSTPGKGTTITATFQYSNIDRQPLGDMASTIVTILLSNPDIRVIYHHQTDGDFFTFDSNVIKSILEGVSIRSPEVIQFIKDMIRERKNLE